TGQNAAKRSHGVLRRVQHRVAARGGHQRICQHLGLAARIAYDEIEAVVGLAESARAARQRVDEPSALIRARCPYVGALDPAVEMILANAQRQEGLGRRPESW